MSAGVYEALMFTGHRIPVERAWLCETCKVSWYDDRGCPRCHGPGIPEPLPEGTKILKEPKP